MGKEPALPKNIRQIGEISGREKICIEDYVMTWIHKREQQEEKGYLGIFFGEQAETEDSVYVYVRGVFELPAQLQEPQEREEIRKEYETVFGDWSVLGCCVIGSYPTERMKALASWLPESGRLIYHLQEQEETLYWTGGEEYQRLKGYFVFYEQNRKMQEYLLQVFKDNNVEKEGAPDRAIRSFREKVKEKGAQRQGSFLRMASSFFVVAILIIGAIVVNRIDDIRLARSLSSAEDVPVYLSQEKGNTLQSSASGDADASGRTAQEDAESTAQYGTAAGIAQYNAIQEAASEAELAGSDAFWEKSDLEDATEPQTETAPADSAAAGTSGEAAPTDPTTIGASGESVSADPAAAGMTGETVSSDPATDGASGEPVSDNPTAAVLSEELPDAAADSISSGSADAPQTDASAVSSGEENAQEAVAARHTQSGYVIREGDTLAAICSRYYGSLDRVADVCEVNGIEDADLILPGQRIVLP